MSFAAGMGAGMGAGIGSGIAIGMSSGQKKTLEQLRTYLDEHQLTIHDSAGKVVDPELVLQSAVHSCNTTNNKTTLVVCVATGILLATLFGGLFLYLLLS